MSNLPTTFSAFGLTLTTADATPEALAYLIQYGLNKSLQDSVAGAKALLTAAHTAGEGADFERGCEDAGLDPDAAAKGPAADFVGAVVAARQTKRLEAILKGTIGQRSASAPKPKKDPLEAEAEAVAWEILSAAVKAQGQKLPKGEAKADLITKYLSKYGEKTTAEAKRRLKATSATVDLSDII